MTAGYKWKPLRRCELLPPSEALIAIGMHDLKTDRAGAIAALNEEAAGCEYWKNDLYQVQVRRHPAEGVAHINIRRLDGFPGRDWRHFQQIKDEIVGAECEAIELYPARSRLVDTSNKYHLWASLDPKFRFPIGFSRRDVQHGDNTEGGLRQRPPMKGGE